MKMDWAIDLDIKSFFDEIDHELMMKALSRFTDKKHIHLYVKRWLEAHIQKKDGTIEKRVKGTPQGGVISPLLANIFLHFVFDKWLEKYHPQVKFERYADDFSIYLRSKKAAKRVGNSIYKFLRDKLQFPINREKSGIRKPLDFQVLGFGFVPTYKKGEKGKYQLVAGLSKWKEFKAKLKHLTKKTIPANFEERIQRINLLLRGWINYFKPASIQGKLKKLEEWLRNRLRYCIWSRSFGRKSPNENGKTLFGWV